MTADRRAVTCPDCGLPVVKHELFRDGRCPIVRFAWPSEVMAVVEAGAKTVVFGVDWHVMLRREEESGES